MPEQTPFDDGPVYDLLLGDLDYGFDFYVDLAKRAAGPVLDIACGTGRILIPCLEAGIDIEGLDLYEPMMEQLRSKAQPKGLQPRLHRADMSNFQLARQFALIMIPFNAFIHNLTADDQIRSLTLCREHLLPGGLLVFDTFFPASAGVKSPDATRVLELETKDPATSLPVRLYDTRTFDRVRQTQWSQMDVEFLDEAGQIRRVVRSETTTRWIYKTEMELLLRLAGFPRWEVCGDFDRRPLERRNGSDDRFCVEVAGRFNLQDRERPCELFTPGHGGRPAAKKIRRLRRAGYSMQRTGRALRGTVGDSRRRRAIGRRIPESTGRSWVPRPVECCGECESRRFVACAQVSPCAACCSKKSRTSVATSAASRVPDSYMHNTTPLSRKSRLSRLTTTSIVRSNLLNPCSARKVRLQGQDDFSDRRQARSTSARPATAGNRRSGNRTRPRSLASLSRQDHFAADLSRQFQFRGGQIEVRGDDRTDWRVTCRRAALSGHVVDEHIVNRRFAVFRQPLRDARTHVPAGPNPAGRLAVRLPPARRSGSPPWSFSQRRLSDS